MNPKHKSSESVREAQPLALIVEDNKMNQYLLHRMLQKIGIKSEVAENGREALRNISTHHYDLIFMDCIMPEMDGYEATRNIRKLEKKGAHIPIIGVTACAISEVRKRCESAGMDSYLHKPIAMREITQVVEKHLHEERPEKENG